MDILLETRGLTRDFSGFVAVNGVDLRVRRGSIHALIGPNGAGKTTVFNLLTRFLPASAGAILFDGQDITGSLPRPRWPGWARPLVPDLGGVPRPDRPRERARGPAAPARDLLPLLALAAQPRRARRAGDRAARPRSTSRRSATGRRSSSRTGASGRSSSRPRWRSIHELLLLDEPTQGMGREDVGRVVALIRKLARDRTVLHGRAQPLGRRRPLRHDHGAARGSVLAEGSYADVSRDPAVLEAYIGAAA